MEAADEDGMAATSFMSPPLDINPGFRYNASFKIKRSILCPFQAAQQRGAATLTGSIYLHFFDVNNDSERGIHSLEILHPAILQANGSVSTFPL